MLKSVKRAGTDIAKVIKDPKYLQYPLLQQQKQIDCDLRILYNTWQNIAWRTMTMPAFGKTGQGKPQPKNRGTN